MKIKIDDIDYELSFDKAIKAGLLNRVKRPIYYSDLKNGDIVKTIDSNNAPSNDTYLMVNVALDNAKQSVRINSKPLLSYQLVYVSSVYDTTARFAILQKDGHWITTI